MADLEITVGMRWIDRVGFSCVGTHGRRGEHASRGQTDNGFIHTIHLLAVLGLMAASESIGF